MTATSNGSRSCASAWHDSVDMKWTVIIPMSPLDRAKTRLADASSSPAQHRALVRAMRRDTVAAILPARDVARVLVVTATPDAAQADLIGLAGVLGPDRIVVIADPAHDGLNPAVAHAATHARDSWPADGVATMVADLPALTTAAVDVVLARAALVDLGVVVDRQGMGTTMLTAGPGQHLHPRFGAGSARRHLELGATRLAAPAPARTDVDVLDDLDAARGLGLGPAMAALLAAGELPASRPDRRD